MHPALLAKAIPALYPQEITLEEFQANSGIVSRITAKDVLEYIVNNGIGISTSTPNHYLFSKIDKMKLAMLALQRGCDIESISKSISWKDFEALTSEILGLYGYLTKTNIRLSKPSRIEIDVIGINNNKLAIVADCKHWKRSSLMLRSIQRPSSGSGPVGSSLQTSTSSVILIISKPNSSRRLTGSFCATANT